MLVLITAVQVPSDESGRGPPPVHFTVHPETSKVVVAAGNRLGARSSYGRSILLATILQTPVTNPQDEVSVEVPMEQVSHSNNNIMYYLCVWPNFSQGISSMHQCGPIFVRGWGPLDSLRNVQNLSLKQGSPHNH